MTGDDDGGENVGVDMLAVAELLAIGYVDVNLIEVVVVPELVGTPPMVGCVVPSPVPLDCCTDGEFVVVGVVGLDNGFDVMKLDEGGRLEVGNKEPLELEVSSSSLDVVVVFEMEMNPFVVEEIGKSSVVAVVSEVDVES